MQWVNCAFITIVYSFLYLASFLHSRFSSTLPLRNAKESYVWHRRTWCERLFPYFLLQSQILLEKAIWEGRAPLENCIVLIQNFLCFLIPTMMDSYLFQSKLSIFHLYLRKKVLKCADLLSSSTLLLSLYKLCAIKFNFNDYTYCRPWIFYGIHVQSNFLYHVSFVSWSPWWVGCLSFLGEWLIINICK